MYFKIVGGQNCIHSRKPLKRHWSRHNDQNKHADKFC